MAEIPITERWRPYLFSIAYRMLGSVSDAEDMVQETFLRWQRTADPDAVESPKSYLSTAITRLCMEHLRKAYVRRESYVGPWLPDPLCTEEASQEEQSQLYEEISIAFLLLLERLSPVERAVFLLREAFDYKYKEIAQIVGKSEDSCRQIIHRSQGKLQADRPRFETSEQEHQEVLFRFVRSCTHGDVDGLLSVLSPEVVFVSDSGGKAKAARRPILGVDKVIRLLLALLRKTPEGTHTSLTHLNGSPAVLQSLDGEPKSVVTFDIHEGQIQAIYTTVNPEKLRHLRPLCPKNEPESEG